jgi:hypothetical protein
MAECFTFPIEDVRAAKKRAARAARIGPNVEPVAGTLDPAPVLESFGCLRLKPGWKLFAYLLGEQIGGESRVVAVPADFDPEGAVLESVGARPRSADRPYSEDGVWERDLRLPRPARRRFMSVVEGDGSPWSVLCASLAVRALLDYAAWWHALYAHDWDDHIILARSGPPRSLLHEPAWVFEGDPPDLWRPAVWVGRSSNTARFYTYRPAAANPEGIWLHEDLYQPGSVDPEISRTSIAQGAMAMVMY